MANKPLVVHLIHSLNRGGCELMLLRTLPKLSRFSHHIVTLGSDGVLAPQFLSQNIPVSPFRSLFYLRPKLVITYLFHADLVGRLILGPFTKYRVIPFLRTTYNHPRYLPARIFEWLTHSWVSHYLANSQAVKDFYIEHVHVNPYKITVVPTGIDINGYALNPKLRQTYRRQLRIPRSDTVMVCVANFHPNKGHENLLQAFDVVYRTFPNTWLLLVGDGQSRAKLKSLANSSISGPHIQFLGSRQDVSSLLNTCDIFILPTLFEGMSNAILEAMAAGLPVITTDIPENRALISSGRNGLLYNKQQVSELVQKLNKLILKPQLRSELGCAARLTVFSTYNLENIIISWTKFISTQV